MMLKIDSATLHLEKTTPSGSDKSVGDAYLSDHEKTIPLIIQTVPTPDVDLSPRTSPVKEEVIVNECAEKQDSKDQDTAKAAEKRINLAKEKRR